MSTYRPQQPFKGMTIAQMKKKWQSMTPKERSQNVQTFRDAAKNAPKGSTPASKPASKPSTPSRDMQPGKTYGEDVDGASGRPNQNNGNGTYGKPMPSNPPGRTQLRAPSSNGSVPRQSNKGLNSGYTPLGGNSNQRTRYVRGPGGKQVKIVEVKKNGKWVRK